MGVVVAGETKQSVGATFSELSAPTPWPGANARLLGLGVGLPIAPLVRLAQFSAAEFERFTLEWASDYLAKQQHVNEVQQRGGAGDKGRDIVVWLDPANVSPREGANKRGNSSRLTQSFHFFMFEPFFLP